MAYSGEAPKVILDSCARIYATGVEKELVEEDRKRTLQVNQEIAAQALRVLGLAYESLPGREDRSEIAESA